MNKPEPEPMTVRVVRAPRGGPGPLLRRLLFLAVALVGLYFVWPQLIDFFDAIPGLRGIRWFWFALMLLLEAGSFFCYWAVLRVTLDEHRWLVVAPAQLASTAFSRILPGGAAAGGAVAYQMLSSAGVAKARAVTGITAATLLSTAVLLLLPVMSIPATISGAPVASSLLHGLEIGLAMALLIVLACALALFTDWPLRQVGELIQSLLARLRKTDQSHLELPNRLIEERDLIKRALGDKWWLALPAAAGGWLFDFGALLAALAAVEARPNPSLVLLGYVVAAVIAVLPLTPGGLGFVEVGLAATLGLAGVGAAEATTAVLAYRLVSFWLPIPAGLVSVPLFRRKYGTSRR